MSVDEPQSDTTSVGRESATGRRRSRNWLAVARRDFVDARRSRVLWLTIGLFVGFVALVLGFSSTGGDSPGVDALWTFHGIVLFCMPIVVLIVAYRSIAGDCETGRIQYLLGLPNTRGDVLLGTFLSRAGISLLAVAVSLAVGTVLLVVRYPSVPVAELFTLGAAMCLFAVVYTAIGVGVSALARTRGRAIGGVVGVYVGLTVLWGSPNVRPMDSIAYVVEDLLGLSARPNLYEFVYHLSPSFAYSRLVNDLVFDRGADGALAPPENGPFYLEGWFMTAILLVWIVLALCVGYYRFRDAELA